jgi:electron transport complex protein RnfC
MKKRPFFSLAKPKLKYPVQKNLGQKDIIDIPTPKKATLLFNPKNKNGDGLLLNVGNRVKTGQRLDITKGTDDYLISTVTGTVSRILKDSSFFGEIQTAITIDIADEEQLDREFSNVAKTPTLQNAREFLACLPGNPALDSILRVKSRIHTIVISALDRDPMVTTNQLLLMTHADDLKQGIEYLKKIIRAKRVIFVIPPRLLKQAEKTGAEVKTVKPLYPNNVPQLIMKHVLGQVVPSHKTCEEMGVGFISAETVVALSQAFSKGDLPVHKMLTVINKNNKVAHIRVRIGTHIKDILKALNMKTSQGDRIVLGGPMTGNGVYSEDTPVLHGHDALIVQDGRSITLNADNHCINCGECVRACPANIPVNMLIRVLENSLYEDAVNDYDLLSCIECGLCSYVCVARIPVFHYIMLGKQEFVRIQSQEEQNA